MKRTIKCLVAVVVLFSVTNSVAWAAELYIGLIRIERESVNRMDVSRKKYYGRDQVFSMDYTIAENEKAAKEMILKKAQTDYPFTEGWDDFVVKVKQVPKSDLKDLIDRRHKVGKEKNHEQ
ncbi:hypothetical protein HGA64_02735 [Candidatus Falkowbacteria bacterium]|nr:hypothetical protein [Candidatus Falkowbacteria bacterium]